MRLILLIAVIALVVDALYYDGAYTQSAFRQISVATEQLADRFGEPKRTDRNGETAIETREL